MINIGQKTDRNKQAFRIWLTFPSLADARVINRRNDNSNSHPTARIQTKKKQPFLDPEALFFWFVGSARSFGMDTHKKIGEWRWYTITAGGSQQQQQQQKDGIIIILWTPRPKFVRYTTPHGTSAVDWSVPPFQHELLAEGKKEWESWEGEGLETWSPAPEVYVCVCECIHVPEGVQKLFYFIFFFCWLPVIFISLYSVVSQVVDAKGGIQKGREPWNKTRGQFLYACIN